MIGSPSERSDIQDYSGPFFTWLSTSATHGNVLAFPTRATFERTPHIALRSPVCFAPRLMGPILPRGLSADRAYSTTPSRSSGDSRSPQNRQCGSAFALAYIFRLRSCKLMGVVVISPSPPVLPEELQTAGPLCSTGVTPLHRYFGPVRHSLA